MMIKKLEVIDFLKAAENIPIIDVRTPSEYEYGHIVDAHNIPLFTNEERAIIGTTYKKIGRHPAILQGFELIGGRWAEYLRQAEILSPEKKILVHCWRGGMRSGAMAWALSMYGFEVGLLVGGYKAYRKICRASFEKEYPLIVLGGKTGSAKTETLQQMSMQGEQVIDLEYLAQHQGSSFGSMGKMIQPSQEHFENLLFSDLDKMDCSKRIWVENESILIGKMVIPVNIYRQMKACTVIQMNIPIEERITFLNNVYGKLDKEFLKESTIKIAKRLGPLSTKETLAAIEEGRMKDFIRNVLFYYDKTYNHGTSNRVKSTIFELDLDRIDPVGNAKKVIDLMITRQ
jgi:tRNA 2-selenouridine synthase